MLNVLTGVAIRNFFNTMHAGDSLKWWTRAVMEGNERRAIIAWNHNADLFAPYRQSTRIRRQEAG
ncbi:hypothetical protein DDZ14_17350 [Maritimibacter sp. 55A14]|nr:hypothetical protein DDZ14_17350 [Maritimibacter sp. 55A14]